MKQIHEVDSHKQSTMHYGTDLQQTPENPLQHFLEMKGLVAKKQPVKKESKSFILDPLPELTKEERYVLKQELDSEDSGSYLPEEERKQYGQTDRPM